MVAVEVRVELTFLDSVPHVAADAMGLLVQVLGRAFIASERGDHENGDWLLLASTRPWPRHGLPAPGSARHPYEALEVALHPAATSPFGSDYINLYLDLGDERLVLGQSEREVDAVCFSQGHQALVSEGRVGKQNDARHLLDRAVRRAQARTPQRGDQQWREGTRVPRARPGVTDANGSRLDRGPCRSPSSSCGYDGALGAILTITSDGRLLRRRDRADCLVAESSTRIQSFYSANSKFLFVRHVILWCTLG